MPKGNIAGIRPIGYSDPRGYEYAVVDIDLLVPDSENPRIPVQESSLDTLLAVLNDDPNGLFALARDMVAMHGSSPSELLNVTRVGSLLVVKEGNRRVVARRLLHNPEQLRGHVGKAELQRWTKLAAEASAAGLPSEMLVVVGADHEAWIDRRHLGPQSGIGVQQWKPQAKARREQRRRGTRHRTLSLLEGLKKLDPSRFDAIEPPPRTFTTLERLLDFVSARAHIGVDVDEAGRVILTRGQRSVRLIEEVLKDLRKPKGSRLTSRTIHDADLVATYLATLDARVGHTEESEPISLADDADANTGDGGARKAPARTRDILRQFSRRGAHRSVKIIDELSRVRRLKLANASLVLSRVLIEISIDHYAATHGLSFAEDKDPDREQIVKEFVDGVKAARVPVPRPVKDALRFVSSRPKSLSDKLDEVIRDLVRQKRMAPKEAAAKVRELKERSTLELLNDAVHRLEIAPSVDRVDHVLEVIRPVYNAMVDD